MPSSRCISARLDSDDALATLIDANRWLIAGALAEFDEGDPKPPEKAKRRTKKRD